MRSLVFASVAAAMLGVACGPKSAPAHRRRAAPSPSRRAGHHDTNRTASNGHRPLRPTTAAPAQLRPRPQPAAGTPAAEAPAAGRGGRGRGGPPPPPPTPPPAVMPPPVTPIVSATAPTSGSARRPRGRTLGCRRQAAWNMQDGLDHAARREVPRRHELRSRVHRQVRDAGQLQRLPDLRHRRTRTSRCRC